MSAVLAHGIGGRQDLPLPFPYALAGAVVALLVTFLLLGYAWRGSRFRGAEAGRPVPARLARFLDSAGFRAGLRGFGLLAAVWLGVILVAGPRDTADSAAPGVLYVLIWVWVPLLSVVLGPVWRMISPVRTVHLLLARAAGVDPGSGPLRLPSWLGYWPAAAGLAGFVWLELIPTGQAEVSTVNLVFAGYTVTMLVGGLLFGDRWFAAADPVEVYSTLAGKLSPLGRRGDGVLVWRSPFNGLDSQPARPGLAAVVLVLLGSTAYDSISESPWWLRQQQLSDTPTLFGTVGLFATIGVVALAYVATTVVSGRLADGGRWRLPGRFAHSLLPIALGYIVAHYFSLAVLEGQRTLILLADPLGEGNLLGLNTTDVYSALVTPAAVATLQVAAVVGGHVAGAVAAHDRAVRLFPPQQAGLGQVPLLVLMVGYTYLGLTLLFAT